MLGERRDETMCDLVGNIQGQPTDGRGSWSGDGDQLEGL